MTPITYISEQDKDYTNAIKLAVKKPETLLSVLREWEPIAWDALDLFVSFDKKRLKKFLEDEKKERSGKFSENPDCAIILMPEIMFRVSIVANKFTAPWGTAFIRLKENGTIENKNGRYFWND